jgi:syntaxin 16
MINAIKGKIKDLNKMHDKHVNTPDFDEQAEEERAIEILTSEITSVSRRCSRFWSCTVGSKSLKRLFLI